MTSTTVMAETRYTPHILRRNFPLGRPGRPQRDLVEEQSFRLRHCIAIVFAVSAHALAISACLYSKAEFANTSAPHDSVNSTGAQPEAGR